MKIRLLLFLLITLAHYRSYTLIAQPFDLKDTSRFEPVLREVGLAVDGDAFFKNNEYFHPLYEGYTLPGFLLQPRAYMLLGDKFKVEAGIHLAKYSGRNGLKQVEPLFRALYQPTNDFTMILGWLKGTSQHNLIEPLYQWERMYTHPLENGAQFLLDKRRFKLDTWIDWEKYIELNDPFQEELTFGLQSKIQAIGSETWELWIPVQATIKHQGGQINANKPPLKSIANWAFGLNSKWEFPGSTRKSLNVNCYFVGFTDMSPQKLQVYKNGYGIYPQVESNLGGFKASAGYWYAHHFIASKGEPLLQSVSVRDNTILYPTRNVVIAKLSYSKFIYKGVAFRGYFETYTDMQLGQMDYAYGVSLTFNQIFSLYKNQLH